MVLILFTFSILTTTVFIQVEAQLTSYNPTTISYTDEQLLEIINGLPISTTTIISTDKSEYYEEELIILNGIYDKDSRKSITSNLWIITASDRFTDMGLTDMGLLTNYDGTFNKEISYKSINEIGLHTIGIIFDGEIARTTFEVIPFPITIQTDKQDYYIDDLITVNGTITEIDLSKDTAIT